MIMHELPRKCRIVYMFINKNEDDGYSDNKKTREFYRSVRLLMWQLFIAWSEFVMELADILRFYNKGEVPNYYNDATSPWSKY